MGSFFSASSADRVFGVASANAATGSNYWKTYFSDTEQKAVQKNAEKYTLAQIKNKSDQWHNILTGFNIKNGSIDSEDIKSIDAGKVKNLDNAIADQVSGKLDTSGGTLSGMLTWASGQTFDAGNLTGTYAALDGSRITGITASQTNAVPYTGATSNLDLGSRTLTTTSTGTFGNIKTPIISPSADSTSAFQINKADGTTNVLNVDTTNGRVGIGTTAPSQKLDVDGNALVSGTVNRITISTYSPDIVAAPNFYIGEGAGNVTQTAGSAYNSGIGYYSLHDVTTGSHNVGVGANALKTSTEASENTAVGVNALRLTTTSSLNTSIGTHSLRYLTTGSGANTAVGNSALMNATIGYGNVAVGNNTLLAETSGFYNTAVGNSALVNLAGGTYRNTGIGINAGDSVTSGYYNTFIGADSDGTAASWKSIAIGYGAVSTKDYQAVIGSSEITETLLRGNVGIGTTTPAAALDVNGQVKMKVESAQPFACDATHNGTIAVTSSYRMCICKGGTTTWVFTTDGTTTCTW